jgi:hypothetical protein
VSSEELGVIGTSLQKTAKIAFAVEASLTFPHGQGQMIHLQGVFGVDEVFRARQGAWKHGLLVFSMFCYSLVNTQAW